MGLLYVLCSCPGRLGFAFGVLGECECENATPFEGEEVGFSGVVGSVDGLDCESVVLEVPDSEVLTSTSDGGDGMPSSILNASGSGLSSLPLTMSHSQSAIPPGTISTAVCGEYTEMPWAASFSSDCCCESSRVIDFRARKIIG